MGGGGGSPANSCGGRAPERRRQLGKPEGELAAAASFKRSSGDWITGVGAKILKYW